MSTLAELEKRLQRVEDERAVERLIASYGPLVDAGDAAATAELWAVDGSYRAEGWHMRSRDDGYFAARAGANHLRLRRIDGRRQIAERTTHALDGSAEPRELLSRGVTGAL
ncbi:MAG: nuclear transport factor 2 family protein [Mycobacterium sp.]